MKTDVASTAETEIQLDRLVNEGKYEEVLHLLQHETFRKEFKSIVAEQDEKLNLEAAYRFCQYAISLQPEEVYFQKMAFSIAHGLSERYVSFKRKALTHLLDAIKMDKTDWKLKENALLFYDGGLLPEKFVKPFAEIVIRMDPTNRNALKVLEKELDVY